MLIPMLFIGCGGSGGKTLRVTRRALERRLIRAGWTTGLPKAWQFLHIDVPDTQEGRVDYFGPYLPTQQYVNMVQTDVDYDAIDDILMRRCEGDAVLQELQGWRPRPLEVKVPVDKAAGQFRALGRIIALQNMGSVADRIREAGSLMTDGQAYAELGSLSAQLGWAGAEGGNDPTPVAVVVSSLAGGTGAGCVIDVCDVLRCLYPGWGDHAMTVLYAADVFRKTVGSDKLASVQANSLAAIAEIVAGASATDARMSEILARSGIDQPGMTRGGPTQPFIIGTENSRGASLTSETEVYRSVGEALAVIATSKPVQESMVNFVLGNWQAKAIENVDRLGLTPPNAATGFRSFGFSRVSLGRERFEEYAVQRLARSAAEFLSEGYLRAAQERTTEASLTPDEALDRLVTDLSVEFLNLCGLNQRGTKANQIIDAVLDPERAEQVWRKERAEILAEISHLGDALPTVWSRRIRDAAEDREDAFARRAEQMVDEGIVAWCEAAPDRIVGVVSRYVAERGVPVAQELLSWTIGELRSTADALVADALRQRHERDMWAAEMGAVLNGPRPIKAANPAVETGIRECTSRFWFEMLAHVRDRCAQLVLELCSGFLTPLRDQLQTAQNRLESDLGSQPDGRRSRVFDWPVDDVVPSHLEPSKLEFLLEPTSSYPATFERLVAASVTQEDARRAGGELNAARQAVFMGGFHTAGRTAVPVALQHGTGATPTSVEGKWSPRIAKGTGQPASFRADFGVDALLGRAHQWIYRPGERIEQYLQETITEYLSERDRFERPIEDHPDRLRSFRAAFRSAISTAEPLVKINKGRYGSVHVNAPDPGYDLLIEPLPFHATHPARHIAEQILLSPGTGVTEANLDTFFQTQPTASIGIVTYLRLPAHPVVFESIMQPVATAWQKAERTAVDEFWQWRRTRPLREAIPVTSDVRRAMIRGWFTARFLGLVDVLDLSKPVKILDPERGWLPFPYPYLGPGVSRSDRSALLPTILESMSLAFVQYSSNGDETAIVPYRRLYRLGLVDETKLGDFSYEILGPALQDWVDTGRVPDGSLGALGSGDTPEERLASLQERFAKSAESYLKGAREPLTALSFFKASRGRDLAAEIAAAHTSIIDASHHVNDDPEQM